MKYKLKHYCHPAGLKLESGQEICPLEISYHIKGTYVPGKSKVVWVCHALTANSDVSVWWSGIFGESSSFHEENNVVVCANIIGSCYGSSGPLSGSENGNPQYLGFPLVTTRDMANAHEILRQQLEIEEIYLLIGSSLGGQQAQEFAIGLQEKLHKLVLIATNAFHSPYGIAFNEAQRLALLADPSFSEQQANGGKAGLKAARSIAMLSYRSYEGYRQTQAEDSNEKTDDFKASSYQRYQGEKLVERFSAYSYWFLSKAMDGHHVGRKRKSIEDALGSIRAKTLVIGISSDQLFPLQEQEFLSKHIPGAEFHILDSRFGHDGFLVETIQLRYLIDDFLNHDFRNFKFTSFKSITSLN